jgi:hypothetical protein
MQAEDLKFKTYYASEPYLAWKAQIDAFIATLPISDPTPNPKIGAWLDANPRPPLS